MRQENSRKLTSKTPSFHNWAGPVYRRKGKRNLRFSVMQQELRSLPCRSLSVILKTEGQNVPKRGSAQPSGSNSGGSFNQALNGSTNILSTSVKGTHSNNCMALTIGS